MTFHLAGYYKTAMASGTVTELPALTDAVLAINSATSRYFLASDARIFAAYLGVATATGSRGRVYTPWKLPNEVRPINAAGLAPTGTGIPPLATWLNSPIGIPAGDDIIFDAVQSSGGALDVAGLLWLTATGLEPRPNGETLTIRGDIAGSAATAKVWTEMTVTWEYSLPSAKYAIVGSECISTTQIGHRWILDSSSYRPGALSQTALGNLPHPYQMNGTLGVWGYISPPVMPRLEVLCSAADTAASMTVFLQLARL